jgi:Cys-tRNA(Pro)/Cys-tRNA(Cys) deacylase
MTYPSSDSESTPVTRELDRNHIPYRFFRHPGKVSSLEQAARERGQRPEQIIRSILFRLSEDEYMLMLVAGPHQISWPALRKYLGQSRLTMASPEEVERVTGYQIGAVAPFGLPQPLRILADENIFREDEVSIGSGVRHTTVILTQGSLRAALGQVEVVSLAEE